MKKGIFTLLCMFLGMETSAWAQVEDVDWERHYDCMVKSGSIVVDGVGDEFAWQLAPEVGEFTRFQKKGDLTVGFRTCAKMLWDEDNLYILVTVDDPDIWSTMTIRDKDCLCQEETVELFIDPDGDGKDYAEIHINCLNTINDLWIPRNDFKYQDGSPVDWTDLYTWTLEGMQHAVVNYGTINNRQDTDLGSVFEFALPWKGFGKIAGSANIPPKPGDVWRININRYERSRTGDDNIELSGWSPLKLFSYHVPERFGYVRFVDKH
ncbi:carbohydrate-binding family 9-like protein [bacterium]|nr:carbohydrate-binding family 9-like protein [bacterium]